MTLHKLTAGSGYDYLTRQVAALDATDKGHTGLSSYYSERGEAPGVWVGSGIGGIDGLAAGDAVTEQQMQLLYGVGMHPVEGRLGAPFPIHRNDITPLQVEVAHRVSTLASTLPGGVAPAPERARIRTEVAREFFTAEHGRPPRNERELAGFVAIQTRPKTTAVAGYDLTFSPVKSVSTLWAVTDPDTAVVIERAHRAAIRDALSFMETHALFTRTGAGGVRQVHVTGLVATAFTHRDSRAGDPDLHTHVAVANKVRTVTRDGSPGKWLSIDGRVLHRAIVAASETYNSRLEHHLTRALEVRFAARSPTTDLLRGDKRAVREIVGVDPALNARWSSRRTQITDRQADLAARFHADHGRPPTPVEALHLAQQANLETRQHKHTARSLAEQRTTWATQAADVLGSPDAVATMVDRALHPANPVTIAPGPADPAWIEQAAATVIGELEQRRATWQIFHVRAEAERVLRSTGIVVDDPAAVVDRVVSTALEHHSISLAGPTDADLGVHEPASLRRTDGTSVYTVTGSTRYSSVRIMAAEHRILGHAATTGAPVVPTTYLNLALAEAAANDTPLNPGQEALVRTMATSGRRLQLAIAPAGSGKTTALRTLATAWTDAGGNVVALAPSAAAVAAIIDAFGPLATAMHADTLAKLTHTLKATTADPSCAQPPWVAALGAETLLIVDEAAMADTLTLDQVIGFAAARGATVRLVGDTHQLASIGAGGILRDIAYHHGAIHLDHLQRFTDPEEAAATLALRDGNPAAVDAALIYYEDHDRIHVADQHTVLDHVHHAWATDRAAGLDALMLAPTLDTVHDLNTRAQAAIFGTARRAVVALGDGHTAGIGDTILTRRNDRRLALSATDWVKNGDRWTIHSLTDDGGLRVAHARTGLHVDLPADYVRDAVQLGYASTVHTAQGTTADSVRGLLTGLEDRQLLYTLLTRGRHHNHAYIAVAATTGDPHDTLNPQATHPLTARETLRTIIDRDGAATSATTELARATNPDTLLIQAVDRYTDALHHACADLLGATTINAIETYADRLVPGLTDQPAWPTLRAHLIHAALSGDNPHEMLHTAARTRHTLDAHDTAALIHWRITGNSPADQPADQAAAQQPATALPGIPRQLRDHPTWGPYLEGRRNLIRLRADKHQRPHATTASPNAHDTARPTLPSLGRTPPTTVPPR